MLLVNLTNNKQKYNCILNSQADSRQSGPRTRHGWMWWYHNKGVSNFLLYVHTPPDILNCSAAPDCKETSYSWGRSNLLGDVQKTAENAEDIIKRKKEVCSHLLQIKIILGVENESTKL